MIAGKFVGLIGCTIAVVLWMANVRHTESAVAFAMLPWMVLPPIAVGAIVWSVGWIIDGFSKPRGERE